MNKKTKKTLINVIFSTILFGILIVILSYQIVESEKKVSYDLGYSVGWSGNIYPISRGKIGYENEWFNGWQDGVRDLKIHQQDFQKVES